MEITVTLTGVGKLLCHNEILANPFHPITRAMKELTSQRKKTDEVLHAITRTEFEGGLYMDANGPYIPTYNVKRSFVEGGRVSKLGKHIERAFYPLTSNATLQYDGPRDVEGMFAHPAMKDISSVRVGTAKTSRCRPCFIGWNLSFPALLETDLLNLEELERSADIAGKMVGIGDFRQRYGRYTVKFS